jgi:hypothetical protein
MEDFSEDTGGTGWDFLGGCSSHGYTVNSAALRNPRCFAANSPEGAANGDKEPTNHNKMGKFQWI